MDATGGSRVSVALTNIEIDRSQPSATRRLEFALPTTGCALVTGASRGIGLAVAQALARGGLPVGINFRSDETAARAAAQAITNAGGRAVVVGADVSDAESVDRLFNALEDEFGAVSVLVNNAGVRADGLLANLDDEQWRTVLSTNLTGSFHTMRRALPSMIRARFGRIVNVASVLGAHSIPGVGNYAAAKAGLGALTRSVAVEVARKGVTVNAVAPGLARTDMTHDVAHLDQSVRRHVPMRRAASPDEVAACVCFLASTAAGYVTGATLAVDGGLSAAAFQLS
ncbi:SDR family NAD(P)-dependent oxidoreductase [Micromonospora sp. NPDC049047]|uniref:SDR family oxidoreductase n=1 Tax=Micromonospora sp. NPDC049047 TaxID=3155645 RepID=UPI0033C9EFC2